MTGKKRRRKRKRGREGKRVLFPVYVDPGWLDRFDRIAEAFEKMLPRGAYLTRSDGARAAINVGLTAIERELERTPEAKEDGSDKQ
jgi:hypothetical protein